MFKGVKLFLILSHNCLQLVKILLFLRFTKPILILLQLEVFKNKFFIFSELLVGNQFIILICFFKFIFLNFYLNKIRIYNG